MQRLTALCNEYGLRDDVNLRMLLLNRVESPYFSDEFGKVHSHFQRFMDLKVNVFKPDRGCSCPKCSRKRLEKDLMKEEFYQILPDGLPVDELDLPEASEFKKTEEKEGEMDLWIYKDIHPNLLTGLEVTVVAAMYCYAVASYTDDYLHDRLWDVCREMGRATDKYIRKTREDFRVLGKNTSIVNELCATLVLAGVLEPRKDEVFDTSLRSSNLSTSIYEWRAPVGTKLIFLDDKGLRETEYKYTDICYADYDIEDIQRAFDASMGVMYEAYWRHVSEVEAKGFEAEVESVSKQLRTKEKAEQRLNKQLKDLESRNKILKEQNIQLNDKKDAEYKEQLIALQDKLEVGKKQLSTLTYENGQLTESVKGLERQLSKCKSTQEFGSFIQKIMEQDSCVEETSQESLNLKDLQERLKGYRLVILGGHTRWKVNIREQLVAAQIHHLLVDSYKIKQNSNDIVIFNICNMAHADFYKLQANADFEEMFFTASRGVSNFAYVIQECMRRKLGKAI